METELLLTLSIATLAYALASRRQFGMLVSAPLAFTTLGLFLGGFGIGWIRFDVSSDALNTLAEITLVLALFCDASTINVTALSRRHAVPARLLGVGLPLTILLGLACAIAIFPQFTFLEALLLAIILAPTDAALGRAVISHPSVPIGVRRALNVESGLNDGLAFPALLIVASFAVTESHAVELRALMEWSGFIMAQLALGPAAGCALGWAGARLINSAVDRNSISSGFLRLSTVALPTAAYGVAEWTGGNGFLSAFICGLTVGALSHPLRREIEDFAEAEGQLLSLFVFFALGAVLLPAGLPSMEWHHLIYALLSLTLIRCLPVAICLTGQRLGARTVLFIGWFGPRGLASIIYLLLLMDNYDIDAIDDIAGAVLLTVMLSIVLHGVSASPLAKRFSTSSKDGSSSRNSP